MQEPVPRLILASTSKYRRELLQRLRMPFDVVAPATDESPLAGERATEMSQRLAMAKAQAVAVLHPAAIVIGSDQVAECAGEPIGKPHTHERAVAQLRQMSGRSVAFHTAVAVVHLESGYARCVHVPVDVQFRALSDTDIQAYLRLEQPYDCAGSAKCETLGISLLDAIRSDDPTALIGLPLIATSALLREVGADPLRWAGVDHAC